MTKGQIKFYWSKTTNIYFIYFLQFTRSLQSLINGHFIVKQMTTGWPRCKPGNVDIPTETFPLLRNIKETEGITQLLRKTGYRFAYLMKKINKLLQTEPKNTQSPTHDQKTDD